MKKFVIRFNLILLALMLAATSSLAPRRVVSFIRYQTENINCNNNNNNIRVIIMASSKKLATTKTTIINQSKNGGDTTTPSSPITTSDVTKTTENDSSIADTTIFRKTWNPLRLGVLRLGLTEPAMTSALNYGKYDGTFTCAYCGHDLFDSTAKYDSGSGWPSFWRSINNEAIQYRREGDGRLEVRCKKCTSHLGHVFLDGPKQNTVPQELLESSPSSDPRSTKRDNLPRFCLNGAALRYNSRDKK
jgi:peptide-methionine (R)-S-oxide reductase